MVGRPARRLCPRGDPGRHDAQGRRQPARRAWLRRRAVRPVSCTADNMAMGWPYHPNDRSTVPSDGDEIVIMRHGHPVVLKPVANPARALSAGDLDWLGSIGWAGGPIAR